MLRWNERRLVRDDIKLLFRSLLYDRRSVEIVVLALILRQTKEKEESEEERTEVESEYNK